MPSFYAFDILEHPNVPSRLVRLAGKFVTSTLTTTSHLDLLTFQLRGNRVCPPERPAWQVTSTQRTSIGAAWYLAVRWRRGTRGTRWDRAFSPSFCSSWWAQASSKSSGRRKAVDRSVASWASCP